MIKEIVKEKDIKFQIGDVLVLRFGYTTKWESFSVEERKAKASHGAAAIGLEQTEEMCRFLYENHFSAVCGDTVALEAWPPQNYDWCIHDHLLGRWGVPIGTLLDLRYAVIRPAGYRRDVVSGEAGRRVPQAQSVHVLPVRFSSLLDSSTDDSAARPRRSTKQPPSRACRMLWPSCEMSRTISSCQWNVPCKAINRL
jgi:hypothetical protein